MSGNMFKEIVFNGTSSKDFGLYVSGSGVFNSPVFEYEATSVPGKSGDILMSNGRYTNVKVTYPIAIEKDFMYSSRGVKAWLLSPVGYCRLEDEYNPDMFRMARISEGIEWSAMFDTLCSKEYDAAASATLSFDCKPQLWLKAGEQEIACTNGMVIYNPTLFDATPLIRVVGTGSVSINDVQIAVNTAGDEYIDIDCDLCDAFEGTANRNSCIELTDEDFPVLVPGENGIAFEGLTSVTIIPRWWTL